MPLQLYLLAIFWFAKYAAGMGIDASEVACEARNALGSCSPARHHLALNRPAISCHGGLDFSSVQRFLCVLVKVHCSIFDRLEYSRTHATLPLFDYFRQWPYTRAIATLRWPLKWPPGGKKTAFSICGPRRGSRSFLPLCCLSANGRPP